MAMEDSGMTKANQLKRPWTSAGPFPFFGTHGTATIWSRPSSLTFSTWLNQVDAIGGGTGPATATLDDNADGLPLVLTAGFNTSAPNGYFPTGVFKTIGSPPWTITVALAGFGNKGQPLFYPIMLYDTANHKVTVMYWFAASTGGAGVAVHRIANADNLSTITDTGVADNYAFSFSDYFGWFRVVNQGGTLTYSISPEGILFKEIYAESASAFLGTIDKVGFGLDRANVSNVIDSPANLSNSSSILWSWVES